MWPHFAAIDFNIFTELPSTYEYIHKCLKLILFRAIKLTMIAESLIKLFCAPYFAEYDFIISFLKLN